MKDYGAKDMASHKRLKQDKAIIRHDQVMGSQSSERRTPAGFRYVEDVLHENGDSSLTSHFVFEVMELETYQSDHGVKVWASVVRAIDSDEITDDSCGSFPGGAVGARMTQAALRSATVTKHKSDDYTWGCLSGCVAAIQTLAASGSRSRQPTS